MQAFPRNRGKERVRLSLGQRTNHLVSGRPQRGARLPRHAHPVGACRRLVSQERSGGRDRGGLSRPRREGPTIRPAGLSIRCSTRATEKAIANRKGAPVAPVAWLMLGGHNLAAIVGKLGEKGLYAEAVAHVGLSGKPDEHIWNYALEHDFTVVTTNARDFIRLLNVEVHPGLIVLRESGLTRDEQWDRIQPIIDHILESSDDDFLLNKLVEISAADEWEIREIPKP